MKTNKKTLEAKICVLEKSANEAYTNSINPELVLHSTNKYVKTRTSEAKRYASLMVELKAVKFALFCLEIEEGLPDFGKMSMNEIHTWAGGGYPIHCYQCGKGEEESVILHENCDYYLAIIRYSEDGLIAEARGVRITPHIADVLTSRGLRTVEN